MALVSLVSPEINAEFPFAPLSTQLIPVDATLTGTGADPADWTLRAASLTFPGDVVIDDQPMTNASGTQNWSVSVNPGTLPGAKPSANNLQIRVTATKNAGGGGAAFAQIMCWEEESSSSSSSDSSDGLKAEAKAKPPLKVVKAKAAMAKTAAKPAPVAKKATPVKKPAPPAKKLAKKK